MVLQTALFGTAAALLLWPTAGPVASGLLVWLSRSASNSPGAVLRL